VASTAIRGEWAQSGCFCRRRSPAGIQSAPRQKRLAAIAIEKEFFPVDPSGLTEEQQAKIALTLIDARMRRDLLLAGVSLAVAVLLAVIAIATIRASNDSDRRTDLIRRLVALRKELEDKKKEHCDRNYTLITNCLKYTFDKSGKARDHELQAEVKLADERAHRTSRCYTSAPCDEEYSNCSERYCYSHGCTSLNNDEPYFAAEAAQCKEAINSIEQKIKEAEEMLHRMSQPIELPLQPVALTLWRV
jgi:hypothetical protein